MTPRKAGVVQSKLSVYRRKIPLVSVVRIGKVKNINFPFALSVQILGFFSFHCRKYQLEFSRARNAKMRRGLIKFSERRSDEFSIYNNTILII